MARPIEVLCVSAENATVRTILGPRSRTRSTGHGIPSEESRPRDDDLVVDAVETIDGALSALQARRYDVVVTDHRLADGTGLGLADRLEGGPPVVFCPTNGSESLAGRGLAAGVDAYVPAGEAADVLVDRILHAVDEARGSRGDPSAAREPAETSAAGAQRPPVADEDHTPDRRTNESHTPDRRAADDLSPTRRLSLLFEQSPLAIIEWTTDFEVARWNAAAEELFGYSEEAAIGRHPTELLLPADERDAVERAWSQLLDGDRSLLHGVNDNVTAGGDRITCEWHNVPLTDTGGTIIGVLSFARDITDETRRAETLSALHESTRSLFRADNADAVAERIVGSAVNVLETSCAELLIYDADVDCLDRIATAGSGNRQLASDVDGIIREAYANDELRYVARLDPGATDAEDPPIRSLVCYPLDRHGVLVLGSEAPDAFDDIDRRLGQVLAATGTAALDRAERERSLRRSRAIVEAIGDGVYALDENGTVIAANDTLASMLDCNPSEIEGEHVSAFIEPESIEQANRIVRTLLGIGGADPIEDGDAADGIYRSDDLEPTWTGEFELRPSNGEPFPCEVTLSTLEDAGEFTGTVGIVRDVSERKRMEAAIQDRRRTIEALYDVTARLETCRDRAEVYDLATAAATDIFAADACAIAEPDNGRLAVRGVEPVDLEYRNRQPLDDTVGGWSYNNGERTLLDSAPDPETTIVAGDEHESVLVVPISDHGVLELASTEEAAFDEDDAELVDLFLTHVAAALDQLTYEAKLRDERDRLVALFENVPTPVITTEFVNGEPIVIDVNEAFEEVFGYAREEVRGESIDEFIVPPEHREEAKRLGKRSAEGEPIEAEVERQTATGLRDFRLQVVPVDVDADASVTYALYTDVTERKQRRKRVEVLNRVLRHDLRNGMNLVKGSAEIIQDCADGTEPETHAQTIEQRADELIALAEKTRAVERTLSHDGDPIGPIDVVETTRRAVRHIHAEHPDAAFELDCPESASARADEMIESALYHLLHNAVVHNDEQIPAVEVAVEEDGNATEIRIADNGPGIPDEERALIAEEQEITQLRHASGLGLWIANWVVTQSGGSLEFADNEPKGTVVTVRLPAASPGDPIPEAEPTS